MRWTVLASLLLACGGASPPTEQGVGAPARALGSPRGTSEVGSVPATATVTGEETAEDEPPPTASLSREHIRAKMSGVANAMRRCYEAQVLSIEPDREGRVSSSFIIGPVGRVESVEFGDDAIGSEPLRDCMSEVLHGVRFDPPGVRVGVNYPWVFYVAE